MPTETATERKIHTHFDNPPIPVRHFDWSAWTDDSDEERGPYGHGATEAEAIADLEAQIEDED